jgi:hypothetical protein
MGCDGRSCRARATACGSREEAVVDEEGGGEEEWVKDERLEEDAEGEGEEDRRPVIRHTSVECARLCHNGGGNSTRVSEWKHWERERL